MTIALSRKNTFQGEGKNPLPIIVFLAVLFALVLNILYGTRFFPLANGNFNDCFSRRGIKEIYATRGGGFIRVCELESGGFIAQEVFKANGEWNISNVYLADDILNLPGLLLKVYPYSGQEFFVYIEELLTIVLE